MSESMDKKRLGIFVFFDSEGIVDPYVTYLLDDMVRNLTKLIIVCNGVLSVEGRRVFEQYTDTIIVRENKGFDGGAWQDVLLRYEDELANYDELVMFNDTFYGPLYPFKEVFAEMESRDPVDFWGLTVHEKDSDPWKLCSYGYIPEHIQTYFIVFNKHLFMDVAFLDYWRNLPELNNFAEAVCFNEAVLTKYFSDKGFTYDVYSDTREFQKPYDLKLNPYMFMPLLMLSKFKLPVIKRKIFVTDRKDLLGKNYVTATNEILEYIDQNSHFDVSLIKKHLVRIYNVYDVKRFFNLNYILPKDKVEGESLLVSKRVALFVYLFYDDMLDECLNYVSNVPDYIDLFIISNTEEKVATINKLLEHYKISNVKTMVVSVKGRDLGTFLLGGKSYFKDYDYIGFIHDKKSIRINEPMTEGRSFFELLWENMLYSEGYINNVLNTMESDPCLGVLIPPIPYHGNYGLSQGNFWHQCMCEVEKLSERFNVDFQLDVNKPVIAVGSVFWAKYDSIRQLLDYNWQESDFPGEPMPLNDTICHGIERVFPYLAQANGYYTGWVMNPNYGRAFFENFYYWTEAFWKFSGGHNVDPMKVAYGRIKFAIKSRTPKFLWPVFRIFEKPIKLIAVKILK